jgi:hypothetical protein
MIKIDKNLELKITKSVTCGCCNIAWNILTVCYNTILITCRGYVFEPTCVFSRIQNRIEEAFNRIREPFCKFGFKNTQLKMMYTANNTLNN